MPDYPCTLESKFSEVPAGDWKVLGGGYIGWTTSPVPEYSYTFPCVRVDKDRKESFRLVRCALGDIALFTPGMVFRGGVPQEELAPTIVRHKLLIQDEPKSGERSLARLLNRVTLADAGAEYQAQLCDLIAMFPECEEMPLVVYKCEGGGYFAAFAAEWYRFWYGHTSYLANAYMAESADALITKLIEPNLTRTLTNSDLRELNICSNGEVWLGVVPRKGVPDSECLNVSAFIHPNSSKQALTNALYAGGSVRAAASLERPPWLKFRHPFPQQRRLVAAEGFNGKVRTDTGEHLPIFLATAIQGQSMPQHPKVAILRRENESRSVDLECPVDANAPDSTRKSGKYLPDTVPALSATLTPNENPIAGASHSDHPGPQRFIFGLGKLPKLPRRRSPNPELERPVPIVVGEDEPDIPHTTNQSRSAFGNARPASGESAESQMVKPGIDMVIEALEELSKDGYIQELQALNFNPSRFRYRGFEMQQFHATPLNGLRGTWHIMGAMHRRPRLLLCVTFRHDDIDFTILDIERRSASDSFSFLLVQALDDHGEMAEEMSALADRLMEYRGNLGKAQVAKSFASHRICKHVRGSSVNDDVAPKLSTSYLKSQMRRLVKGHSGRG